MTEGLRFLQTAFKDWKVGAVWPTGNRGVKSCCKVIPFDQPVVVVEYGPGLGNFTQYLLDRLHPESVVVAIEANKDFAEQLEKKYSSQVNPRVIVANDDCRNIESIIDQHQLDKPSFVISGIPFSFFKQEMRDEIVEITHDALQEDGMFIVYQYSKTMVPTLSKSFQKVSTSKVWLNVPPLEIMIAKKENESN